MLTEEPLIIQWFKSMSSHHTCLDVGANVGSYVLLDKAFNPSIKVVAAELDFNNLYLLYHNLVINKLHDDVVILPFALGDSMRFSNVFYRDLSQGDALQSMDHLTNFSTTSSPLQHQFKHLVIPLDTLYDLYELPTPDFIKVDVDGNERQFLAGARRTLLNASQIYFEDSLTEDCVLFKDFLITHGFILNAEVPIYSKLNTSTIAGYNQIYIK